MTISATAAHQTTPITSASPRALASWVLFEWATQPFYTLIVTFLFAPYFANVVVGNQAEGQALWEATSAKRSSLLRKMPLPTTSSAPPLWPPWSITWWSTLVRRTRLGCEIYRRLKS